MMKRAISVTCLVLAFVAMPSIGQATAILIDFDAPPLGGIATGTVVKQVGSFVVTVGFFDGTIVDDVASPISGGFSGQYLSSVGAPNDGRVDLHFSTAIVGQVTLDANYQNTGGNDFQVVDLLTSTVVHTEIDGPNTMFISFLLLNPTTQLRFRDNSVEPVQIDNLSVNAVNNPVPEPSTMLLLGSGLVGLVFFRRRRKREA